MNPKQTLMVLGTFLLVLLAWLVVAAALSRPEPAPALWRGAPAFDARRALEFTRELATRYPRRVLGSFESRHSTGYLKLRLEAMGYTVDFNHFDAVVAGRRQVGRNLRTVRQGRSAESIVVVAHYDTAPATVGGAMDDASGVGVLLELARIWSVEQPKRTLVFLLTDGGEWGSLGARDFAASYPERARTIAALSLDFVAAGELAAERLDCAGQERGYTPPWLRELAREAARSIPARVAGPSALQEQLERALELSWSDQGAFLGAGVAAVNLGSISDDTALRLRRARFDAIDNMRLSSFAVYGRTAEKILRTLDELPERPSGTRSPVRIAGNRYLPENAMVRLHWLAFLPLAAMLCFHIANHRSASARMTGELLGFLGAFLPLALGYATILLCGRIRMLPRYSYYPGTGKDPVLDNPSWGTIGSVVVVVAASAVILGLARRLLFWKLPEPDFFGAKTVELALLVVIVVAALEHNPYWAVVFFALPAWIWGLVGEGEEVGARAANRIAILGAGIICAFVTVYFARALGLGWKVFWYGILALWTGTFSAPGALLGAAAAAVGIRMLAIQSLPAR